MDCLGSLSLLWMNDIHLDVQFFSANHIDVFVRDSQCGFYTWRASGFYFVLQMLLILTALGLFFVT